MPSENQAPIDPKDHLPPEGRKRGAGAGPTAGIIIIVILLVAGAFYFWGAHLSAQNQPDRTLPLIPAQDATSNS